MRLFLIILFSAPLMGCSYKVAKNYLVPISNQVLETCQPQIVKKKNLYGLRPNYLGSISLNDSGLTINCSKEKAIEILKQEACQINANIINITDEAEPNLASTCYRCVADFYSLPTSELSDEILNKEERKILRYETVGILKWSDFMVSLDDTSTVPYEFISNIELYSGSASFWTGRFKSFKAEGVFYSDVSKVKQSFVDEMDVEHVQLLYDLTQLYAKKLEHHLNTNNPKTNNESIIQKIIDQYHQNLINKQKDYIQETNYGRDKTAQLVWIDKVQQELETLDNN